MCALLVGALCRGGMPERSTWTIPVSDATWKLGVRAQVDAADEQTPDQEDAVRVVLTGPPDPAATYSQSNSLVCSGGAALPEQMREWRVVAIRFWVKPVVESDARVLFVVRRGYGEAVPLKGRDWQRIEARTWGAAPLSASEVLSLALRTALPEEGTAFLLGPFQIELENRPRRWMAANGGEFEVNGLWWLEENEGAYIRLPRRAASANAGVWARAQNPAGARVRFRSDTRSLRLRIDHGNDGFPWPMMSSMAMAGVELYEGPPGKMVFRWVATPGSAKEPYEVAVPIRADGTMKEYTLYLPMYAKLASLDLAVDDNARLGKPTPHRVPRPIVFYGTSFVQGGCASRGSMNFPAIVGRRLGVDIVNLGFAGDGRCEAQVADCMAEIDAACFVMGPILNNLALMRERYPVFVKRLREQWPERPIVLMTRLHTVGTRAPYEVNSLVAKVHEQMRVGGDENVYLFDAFGLYADGPEYPTADGVHPTDHGFTIIADALAPFLSNVLGLSKPGME